LRRRAARSQKGSNCSPAPRYRIHAHRVVADLDRGLALYERVFRVGESWPPTTSTRTGPGTPRSSRCRASGTKLELRLNPTQAARQRLFDPITIAVADRSALQSWMDHVDNLGIEHSPPVAGIQAWLVLFRDTDARSPRVYTLETHGPEVPLTRIRHGSRTPNRPPPPPNRSRTKGRLKSPRDLCHSPGGREMPCGVHSWRPLRRPAVKLHVPSSGSSWRQNAASAQLERHLSRVHVINSSVFADTPSNHRFLGIDTMRSFPRHYTKKPLLRCRPT
jgi:hypothetical protein